MPGYIPNTPLPSKSLWNPCATRLPHDTNNWTGMAQPHTTQLSQLTPAAAVGLREQHGAGAVLDLIRFKKRKKLEWKRACS